MATNLAIDDGLLDEALKIGGLKTKKATVNLALEEFIRRRKMDDVIDSFNTAGAIPSGKKSRSKNESTGRCFSLAGCFQ
ncbi:type II toxin-antitoxin system VapB family antitoxin [Brucepastera parasyntrophica]|uniref:type II toxin-antitoxin system VapB family antitoxin n=1 Tax=Brucepastera parasyntrophica TaxID=2880008 RepID=UPI00210B2039|nr:type II toxin-antitoxin system VapB family antitoxin [Brucepastera parasyntrophica]ULQ60228.1 type II toxin-antitoxin system VapB family antitoxin [Brucepastera parasyntrophica]